MLAFTPQKVRFFSLRPLPSFRFSFPLSTPRTSRCSPARSSPLPVLCKCVAVLQRAGQGSGLSSCCPYEALLFQAPTSSSWVHLSGPGLWGLLAESPTSPGVVGFLFSSWGCSEWVRFDCIFLSPVWPQKSLGAAQPPCTGTWGVKKMGTD